MSIALSVFEYREDMNSSHAKKMAKVYAGWAITLAIATYVGSGFSIDLVRLSMVPFGAVIFTIGYFFTHKHDKFEGE